MQKKGRYILFKGLLAGIILILAASGKPWAGGIYILTDRTWALSGDTVWFALINGQEIRDQGNVVHVQLENRFDQTVNSVRVILRNGSGEGYIPVPDSLSTGRYIIRAFNSSMIRQKVEETPGTLLTVVNRFAEDVVSVPGPSGLPVISPVSVPGVFLQVNPSPAGHREKVQVQVTIDEDIRKQIKEVVVSAELAGSQVETSGQLIVSPVSFREPYGDDPFPVEQDGFYIEGRVVSESGESLPGRSLVLLSIPDSIPYFDYCFAGSNGHFRFKLKNAYGTAEIFLRAIGRDTQSLQVELSGDVLSGVHSVYDKPIILDEQWTKYTKDVLEAGWFSRVFSQETRYIDPFFIMEPVYPEPFYGVPDKRVYPSDFIELENFMEISRELLPGVRFRSRDDQYALHILNDLDRNYFTSSPLRLINGIPVFNDNLLYRFNSSDIQHIDVIYRERIYGDISFKGVLALVLSETAGDWLSEQKNLRRFTISCLQVPVEPASLRQPAGLARNVPDFRRVFLFDRLSPEETMKTYEFTTSDLKGDIVVRVQGITYDNQLVELTGKLKVQ